MKLSLFASMEFYFFIKTRNFNKKDSSEEKTNLEMDLDVLQVFN